MSHSDLTVTIPEPTNYNIALIHAIEKQVDNALLQFGFCRTETEKGNAIILQYRRVAIAHGENPKGHTWPTP